MNTWFVWIAFVLTAIVLGLTAYWFSLLALRVAAAVTALAAAAYLTGYGVTHPAKTPGRLSDAFTQGTDAFIRALFHLRSVPPGPHVPGPRWIDWLIIAVLLVIGYRELEALSQHCHARYLDTSELARAQQADSSGGKEDARTDVQRPDWLAAEFVEGALLTDVQRRDRLAAGLKFWLPAVDVRAPAIFPGGSRSSALASIAEASGVNGSGLAGAIIRFFGMLWPSPRRIRVRVWVKGDAFPTRVNAHTRVAVSLDDPGTGASLGTKTLAEDSLDNAACAAAGYVAQRIFAGDPTAPPWCIGMTDGCDLAAMLLARHERVYPETEERINNARDRRIGFLEGVAWSSRCAGVVRYELAHLFDLNGDHVEALTLHANNREQYPRFYRGRYRLAMSLEMIAGSDLETRMKKGEQPTFTAVLRILQRWDGIPGEESDQHCAEDDRLKTYLLKTSQKELQEIRRYLTLWDVILHSFCHRNERGVLRPYWRLRHRQSFHDGVRLAQLLVAVRQKLNGHPYDLPHPQKILRIATAIAGESFCIADLFGIRYTAPKWSVPKKAPQTVMRWGRENPPTMVKRWGRKNPPTMVKRLRTRHWSRRYSTPSWPAAYNLACIYAAMCADLNQSEACMPKTEHGQAPNGSDQIKRQVQTLVGRVVTSLEFAITNPECEMERPSEWIENDPDFACLRSPCGKFSKFTDFLVIQKLRDYPSSMKETRGFMDAAAQGDQGAQEKLHQRFLGLVLSVTGCLGLSGDDAAAVAEATWRRLGQIDRIDDPDRLGAWLADTVRREATRRSC